MRHLLPLIAVGCTLLASCSNNNGLAKSKAFANKGITSIKNTIKRDTVGGYTRADIATLRMRDLNPLARTPKLVKVKQSTLQKIPRERMAFFKRFSLFGRKPVDYSPPSLPQGTLAFDGGLLPSKNGAGAATLDFDGLLPEPTLASNNSAANDPAAELEEEDNFSIE